MSKYALWREKTCLLCSVKFLVPVKKKKNIPIQRFCETEKCNRNRKKIRELYMKDYVNGRR